MEALALVLFAAIVAANCPHKHDWKSLEGHTSERDITIGSQNRTYLLHIPQGFSKTKDKVGFVFPYHEESKDAYYQERISGFSDRALNNTYVAVYPQATNGTWYPGRSSGGNYSDDLTMNSQDHIYTSAILDELYATRGLCLDSTQAYATSLGNGSSFMHHLNCCNVHNPPFQAFAGVAGIPQTLDMSPDRCFHAGFKPLLMIHGTDDNERTKLKTSSGTTLPNLTEYSLTAAWAQAGGFLKDQSPIISIEASQGLKLNWTKYYRLPKNPEAAVKGAIVQLYKFPYVGHVRESKSLSESNSRNLTESNGLEPNEPNVTKMIMDFFRDERCVSQRRNNQKCSPADRLRPAAVLMAVALVSFFLLIRSTPTYS